MNIFVLNSNPLLAARDHCNKHVVKMILEAGQMLCTAHWIGWRRMLKIDASLKSHDLMERLAPEIDPRLLPPWKMSHVSHPCTQWTQRTWGNYMWLSQHGLELCREYTARYGRTHKAEAVHRWLNRVIPPTFETVADTYTATTPFAVAMPEKYKVYDDPVQSYRNYYMGDKARFAKWPTDRVPSWWSPSTYLSQGGHHDTEPNDQEAGPL